MWYLYTLVGIMIILPIMKLIVNNSTQNNNILNYILILLIIFSFVIPNIEYLCGFDFGITIPIKSEFLTYMVLGYMIESRKEPKKTKRENLFCTFFIFICISVIIILNILKVKLNKPTIELIGNYNSLIVMIMSISIFVLFKCIIENKTFKLDNIILKISKYSFGVYIIHMLWINVIYKFLKFSLYGSLMMLNAIIIWSIVIILSILTTVILKYIPIIKKII